MIGGAVSQQWLFRDVLGRETACYRLGSVSALVEEHDERAVYVVRRGEEVIASGGDPSVDASLIAVEDVLVAIGWLWREPEPDALQVAA